MTLQDASGPPQHQAAPVLREEEATAQTEGVRHTVGVGSHRVEKLPKLTRAVASKMEASFVGEVSGGFPVNNWRVQFRCTSGDCTGAPEEITNNGSCALPGFDDGWKARVRLRTTTFSDGEVEVLCLDAKRL